jgi:hypothetical protein
LDFQQGGKLISTNDDREWLKAQAKFVSAKPAATADVILALEEKDFETAQKRVTTKKEKKARKSKGQFKPTTEIDSAEAAKAKKAARKKNLKKLFKC